MKRVRIAFWRALDGALHACPPKRLAVFRHWVCCRAYRFEDEW